MRDSLPPSIYDVNKIEYPFDLNKERRYILSSR